MKTNLQIAPALFLFGVEALGLSSSRPDVRNFEPRAYWADKQPRHATTLRAWHPADLPRWLNEETYSGKIQPRLRGVTVPVLSSALGISQPYAAEIRAGRRKPHPRHWLTLARLVGVEPDE